MPGQNSRHDGFLPQGHAMRMFANQIWACKIKAHSGYVAYEIRTRKLRRLACVRLWNDSYALQYQQRWLNSFVVIWDEHCYCCETHTHTHSVSLSLSLSHAHTHKPVHLAKRACINTAVSTTCGDCPAGYANDGAKGCKGLCVCVCLRVGEPMYGACSSRG